jgi:streptomycin 6-kinase
MPADAWPALPAALVEWIVRAFGEQAGRAWIEGLPGVVAGLARRWELRPDGQPYLGGSHSLVLDVTRAGGAPAVLKVPVRDEENRSEAEALRLYAGDGAALLYAADAGSGALLLERLVPGTPLTSHPDRDLAIDMVSALLRRLRRPVPDGHPFPLVRDLVGRWTEAVPRGLARHPELVPAALVREVAAAVPALALPEDREVLVNRDTHLGNVLAAEREPWLLIDPKPLVGEPAFDGGWLLIDALRPAPSAEYARRQAARIGAGLGVDPDRVRAWALLRAAEDVVWELATGGDAGLYLAVAAALMP